MGCYHPQKMVWDGTLTNKGKRHYIFNKYHEIEPEKINFTQNGKPFYAETIEVPCGKCIGCRLETSRQWANRCMLEAKDHEENQFITLTYDQENVPKAKGVINFETGEIGEVLTLVPKDLQHFIKRLRRYYEYNYNLKDIRFYACGEYGSKTERPHYHVIAFNLPLNDKKLLCIDKKGTRLYRSEIIEKLWTKGISSVADVTWESCAYVARYIMKKVKGKQAVELFKDTGREPEFTRMSRRPGIGRNYFDQNKEKIYECDEIWMKNKKGVFKIKPARYYDKIFDLENPELMEAIKKSRRKAANAAQKYLETVTGISIEEEREKQEAFKLKQIERLKRQLK